MVQPCISIRNGVSFPLSDLPKYAMTEFRELILERVSAGERLAALFHMPLGQRSSVCAVLAGDEEGSLSAAAGLTEGTGFPALTPECMQAHLFEREIAEETGLVPVGHPWLKPVRFTGATAGDMEFFRIEGPGVHEVAVGPVHAGVIEPGHFRFQCHGEIVLHLEISLGYQHRGAEKAFTAASPAMRSLLAESVSGDAAAGHASAHAGAAEALTGCPAPRRALMIRAIAQELERTACHIGDLGALAGDVGFLPTMSYCGRIRGAVLNMTAAICGNRFSRGLIRPGGVRWDIGESLAAKLLEDAASVRADAEDAVGLLWETPTVMARFEGTGVLSRDDATALGLVGPAARACGLERDARSSFPYGGYILDPVPLESASTGDVLARARVRWGEIGRSLDFIERNLRNLPDSSLTVPPSPLRPFSMAVSVAEAWRGETAHIAVTDGKGDLARYKIIDPSFHNWFGLAVSMRNRGISDFPLCNKSFNLSYCGFDL